MRGVVVMVMVLAACKGHSKPPKPYVMTYSCSSGGAQSSSFTIDLAARTLTRGEAAAPNPATGTMMEPGAMTQRLDAKAFSHWREAIDQLVKGAPYKDEPGEGEQDQCWLVVRDGERGVFAVEKSAMRERDAANAFVFDLRKRDGESFSVSVRCGATDATVDIDAKKRTINGVAEVLDDRERLLVVNAMEVLLASTAAAYQPDPAGCSVKIESFKQQMFAIENVSSDRDDALGRLIRLTTKLPESPAPTPSKPYVVRYGCSNWQRGELTETRYDLASATRVATIQKNRASSPTVTATRTLTNNELRRLVPAIDKLLAGGPYKAPPGMTDAFPCTLSVDSEGAQLFKFQFLGGDAGTSTPAEVINLLP